MENLAQDEPKSRTLCPRAFSMTTAMKQPKVFHKIKIFFEKYVDLTL